MWYNVVASHLDYKRQQTLLTDIADKNSHEYQVANSKMVASIDNRDLMALYLAGAYVLAIIDAYAGAHLYDFDIANADIRWTFGVKLHPWGGLYHSAGLSIHFGN